MTNVSHTNRVANVATVDVEDWHALVYRDLTGQEILPTEHTATGTRILLELFGECGVRGTFFVTGRCATAFPELVREIADAGHEVACHGWAHRPVWTFTRDEFREDLRRAVAAVEGVLGGDIMGYRAPFFSIGPSESWALEEVADAGLQYDSSLSPLRFASSQRHVSWFHLTHRCPDVPAVRVRLHSRENPTWCDVRARPRNRANWAASRRPPHPVV